MAVLMIFHTGGEGGSELMLWVQLQGRLPAIMGMCGSDREWMMSAAATVVFYFKIILPDI